MNDRLKLDIITSLILIMSKPIIKIVVVIVVIAVFYKKKKIQNIFDPIIIPVQKLKV